MISKVIMIQARFIAKKSVTTNAGTKLFRMKFGNKDIHISGTIFPACGNGGGTAINMHLSATTDATTGYNYICCGYQRGIPSNYINNTSLDYLINMVSVGPYLD